MMKTLLACFALTIGLFHWPAYGAPPQSFRSAKVAAKQHVYLDRNQAKQGTLYCGCTWRWTGKSGGRVDLSSCGYIPRKNATRAKRIEWEHIVPAWVFGHQRQCWQHGGRKNCEATDAVFRTMESDLNNLAPSIGEVNGDRSNYRYGMVAKTMPNQYGQCTTRTDFKQRVTEPRDAVKGLVARVTFYMYDRYGLSMAKAQQQVLMAWDIKFPVTAWERERDKRVANIMGHHNPFVTGKSTWQLSHVPSREGLREAGQSVVASAAPTRSQAPDRPIIGNRNSYVYHLPQGCPSYDKVAEKNRVYFATQALAKKAGYRLAGTCND